VELSLEGAGAVFPYEFHTVNSPRAPREPTGGVLVRNAAQLQRSRLTVEKSLPKARAHGVQKSGENLPLCLGGHPALVIQILERHAAPQVPQAVEQLGVEGVPQTTGGVRPLSERGLDTWQLPLQQTVQSQRYTKAGPELGRGVHGGTAKVVIKLRSVTSRNISSRAQTPPPPPRPIAHGRPTVDHHTCRSGRSVHNSGILLVVAQ